MERIITNHNITTVSGDGIGPEVIAATKMVLSAVSSKFDMRFNYTEAVAGGIAYDLYGEPLPAESLEKCVKSDAVLLGAVGGNKWDNLSGNLRPEKALLGIRKAMQVYANLRPAKLFPALADCSPLKDVSNGIDYVIVRELTGGIYFGEKGYRTGDFGREAYDEMRYSELEIERVARIAFELAQTRGKKLCSIDKANVLECSRLWRSVVHTIDVEYPDVTVTDMLVDNAAMQLVKRPTQFDVIVTGNMFGDILSDLAAITVGSIGVQPSASLGVTNQGLYEAIHGSAPDIAGTDSANPIGTILSAAMMLEYSFDRADASAAIFRAVEDTLNCGFRTADIMATGKTCLSTTAITEQIIKRI